MPEISFIDKFEFCLHVILFTKLTFLWKNICNGYKEYIYIYILYIDIVV